MICGIRYKRNFFSLAALAILWTFFSVAAIPGFDLAGNILSPLIAFLSAFLLVRAAIVAGKRRLGWAMAGAACCIWGLADFLWALDLNILHQDPDTSVVLSFTYTASNACFLVAVLYLALYNRRRWATFQFLLDICVFAVLVTGFIYFVILNHFFNFPLILSNPVNLSSLASLVLDLLIISFTISTLLSMNRRKLFRFFGCAFIGIVIFIVADFMYIFGLLNKSYIPNGIVDVLYMLSIALIGASGVLYTDKPGSAFHAPLHVNTGHEIIYRALILFAVPIVAICVRHFRFSEMVFFAVVLLIHQIISLIVRRLMQSELELESKSREAERLEARVGERTRELRVMNQTLENLVKRDAITGQYNRKYFLEQIEGWIHSAQPEKKIWLMILDFDRFKSINDTYGHDVGDKVLRMIGKRLESVANDETVVSRLGGDEFGIVCLRPSDESLLPLLSSISDLCVTPLEVGAFTIHIGLSIGVASWPDDAKTRSDLMRHADIAMYITKKKHPGGYSFF